MPMVFELFRKYSIWKLKKKKPAYAPDDSMRDNTHFKCADWTTLLQALTLTSDYYIFDDFVLSVSWSCTHILY